MRVHTEWARERKRKSTHRLQFCYYLQAIKKNPPFTFFASKILYNDSSTHDNILLSNGTYFFTNHFTPFFANFNAVLFGKYQTLYTLTTHILRHTIFCNRYMYSHRMWQIFFLFIVPCQWDHRCHIKKRRRTGENREKQEKKALETFAWQKCAN